MSGIVSKYSVAFQRINDMKPLKSNVIKIYLWRELDWSVLCSFFYVGS